MKERWGTFVSGQNVLIIIPKNQFCGDELHGLRSALIKNGVHVVVLSKSGNEASSMKQEKFKPDGMIIDWDKQS